MKKLLFAILIFSPMISFCQSDDFIQHNTTHLSENGRYEIVSSSLKRSHTFKLDRYSGKVFQIVKTNTEDYDRIWEEIGINSHPENTQKVTIYDTPSYQLFVSGMMASDVFLMDTKKGYTWNLSNDSATNVLFFYPIVSESFYDKTIKQTIKDDEAPPSKFIKKMIAPFDIQSYSDRTMKNISMEIKAGEVFYILSSDENTHYVWSDGIRVYVYKN